MEDKLCQSCERIVLDDKSFGLEGKGDNESRRLVALPAQKQTTKTHTGFDCSSPCRQDVYPEFPGLAKTAAAGCHCCKFLRPTFREALPNHRPRGVCIHFNFHLFGESVQTGGLDRITLFVRFELAANGSSSGPPLPNIHLCVSSPEST